MKNIIDWLALLSAFCLHPAAVLHAVPMGTAFTYQGGLNDGGQPASGNCKFHSAGRPQWARLADWKSAKEQQDWNSALRLASCVNVWFYWAKLPSLRSRVTVTFGELRADWVCWVASTISESRIGAMNRL